MNCTTIEFEVVQGKDITVEELYPFLHAHAHKRGVRLRLAYVTL